VHGAWLQGLGWKAWGLGAGQDVLGAAYSLFAIGNLWVWGLLSFGFWVLGFGFRVVRQWFGLFRLRLRLL
jgi:hypothetical protein